MQFWLKILQDAVDKEPDNNKAAVARKIGISRTAVSLCLAGKYRGETDKVEQKVLAALSPDVHQCPFLETPVGKGICNTQRESVMPTNSRYRLQWWQACQECPYFSTEETEKEAA